MAIEPHGSGKKEILDKIEDLIGKLNNIDHEQLKNLLGGDNSGHYHLTGEELDELQQLIIDKYAPEIMSGVIDAVANEAINPYTVQGKNVTKS